MIQFDYYTPPKKLPRWVAASLALGGATVAGCLVVLMVHVGRTQLLNGVAGAVAAAPMVAPVAVTPVVTPTPAPVAAPAPTETATAPAPKKAHHGHVAIRHAVKAHGLSGKQIGTVLAKHDSAKKRRSRDDLDRMLGI